MGTSVDFAETGDFGPFNWMAATDSPYVVLTTTAGDIPVGTLTKPRLGVTADFQDLNPIDITLTPEFLSSGPITNDATFYIDPTIVNGTGHVWSGFSLQLVAVDPGQFLEFPGHPDYPHFHDSTAGIFGNPQIGSFSLEGSEVYGYVGDISGGINEEGKATLTSDAQNEIYREAETWQYFGVHAPLGDGTFTLQLTPIVDTVGFAAGDETLLNTSIAGDQVPADYAGGASPSQLAALPNGKAVAVWDNNNSGQVEARIVTAAGPVGQEITVGSGNDGTVAALANGNFIVVWRDPSANQGLGKIKYQIYSASGTAIGGTGSIFGDFNSNGTNYGEYNLSVTGLTDGGYALTFTQEGTGAAPSSQVYTYMYDQNGTNVGHITDGPASSTVSDDLPQTAQLSDGNLVTTWQDGQGHVYAQVFSEDGTSIEQLSLGSPYDNSTGGQGTPSDTVSHPTVAALANGDFVVAWDDQTKDQIQFDIWNDGSARGEPPAFIPEAIALNQAASASGDSVTAPAIATLADGQFAITWADASGSSIKAAVFNPDGTAENDEFVVNKDQSGNQVDPNIVGLSGGGMYIDWGDESAQLGDTSGFGVAGQAFGELYSPSATQEYSVAQFLTNQTSLDLGTDFRISDTPASIAANLDALNADRYVSEIILTGSGTPKLALTSEQAANDWQAIGKIAGPYTLAIETPPNCFNSDTEADILWRNASGTVELWNSNGSGGYTYANLGTVNTSWQIAGTGDFDGSGEAGVLWRNANGSVELWSPNGSGGFSYSNLGAVNTSWQIAGTGDFNGNGQDGVLWRNANGNVELWSPNGSGGFTYDNLGAVNTNWQIAGTGDFNGDGQDGILWRNASTGAVELWNPNGSGGFTYDSLGAVNASWQIAGTGDFSGDGRSGILWRNANGATELWNATGSGGFAYQNLGAVNPSWQIAGTGDYGGDGQSGILWRNASGDTGLWNPNGSGGFTYQDLGVVGTSWSVSKIFA